MRGRPHRIGKGEEGSLSKKKGENVEESEKEVHTNMGEKPKGGKNPKGRKSRT